PRSLTLWRPWLPRAEEGTERQREQTNTVSFILPAGSGQVGLTLLSPPRLLWPRSKSFDYLYSVGEALLENFPVQATLCLYDDSGSEDSEDEVEAEEEEEEEEEAEEDVAGDTTDPLPPVGSARAP
ncbi:RIPP2 protein, partial [Piaya cayana]|nr:RIPP2 protein [Piaya cayana]